MKITRVSSVVYRQQLKLSGPGPNFGGEARDAFETLLVKVETNGGVTGWGEAFPHRVWPALRILIDTTIGPACVGADPADIAGLLKKLAYLYHNVGRAGLVIFGFSGIDMALWDIAGKVAGKPGFDRWRRAARDNPGLCQPPALRQYRCGRALLRRGAWPRLRGTQDLRNHRKGNHRGGRCRREPVATPVR